MMSKEPNFFEAVASHNLERFHSECIAWSLNSFKEDFAIFFIKEVTGLSNIKTITVEAEVDDIDVKLTFKHEGITNIIFIENKIKASESIKKISKSFHKKLNLNGQETVKVGDVVSQTEYYYLKENYRENIDNINLHFCFLHSTDIIGEERDNKWETLNAENPWVKISYSKLFSLIELEDIKPKNISYTIFSAYVKFCREQIKLMGAEPISPNSHCKVILFPIHNALKTRSIYKSTRGNWRISKKLLEINPDYAVGLDHSISLGAFKIKSWTEKSDLGKRKFVKSESINNFPELINKSWSKIISDRGYWKYGKPL